MMEEHVIV